MQRAYWATTSLGPFKEGQVVLFEESDPWIQTGWFLEIVNEWPPDDGHLYIRIDPAIAQSGS
jgi:hypothetical protein